MTEFMIFPHEPAQTAAFFTKRFPLPIVPMAFAPVCFLIFSTILSNWTGLASLPILPKPNLLWLS
jgi:hypothetical protein